MMPNLSVNSDALRRPGLPNNSFKPTPLRGAV